MGIIVVDTHEGPWYLSP